MKTFSWVKIGLFNFMIVSVLGILMRYKIAFSFPFLNQKYLQLSHSNFALLGWVSFILMALMIDIVQKQLSVQEIKRFKMILIAMLIACYGLMISFLISGYSLTTILLQFLNIAVTIVFCFQFYISLNKLPYFESKYWFYASLLFYIISNLGTLYLSYMMASKNIDQHYYLGSIYWNLHFQYNGWFFFACMGLFIHFLNKKSIIIKPINKVFWIFFICCIPNFGLSVLWLKLPLIIYLIIVLASVLQFFGLLILIKSIWKDKIFSKISGIKINKILLYYVSVALIIKFILQLGSTIPSVSHFAFGFRPIVIAYLHLVLLAFTSVFIVMYIHLNFIKESSIIFKRGIYITIVAIFLNELVLAFQGILSIGYVNVPYANEALFIASILIFIGLLFMFFSFKNSRLQQIS